MTRGQWRAIRSSLGLARYMRGQQYGRWLPSLFAAVVMIAIARTHCTCVLFAPTHHGHLVLCILESACVANVSRTIYSIISIITVSLALGALLVHSQVGRR